MTTYLLTGNKEKCCGCTACESVCNKSAITMLPDSEGFLCPILNKDMCVECGLCKSVCPYDKSPVLSEPTEVYGACDINKQSLLNSSSGGVFGVLADRIIKDGGFVCGVVFDECFKAIHILSDKKEDLEKMHGSKYVQSNLKYVFIEIEESLKNRKKVLFTGTPCQVDGLKSYLKKEYDGLYTVDLICHGVPSPLFMERYLEYIKETKGDINAISFRDKKKNGWVASGSIHLKNNKSYSTSYFNDSYYQLFMDGVLFRECCYSCQYATSKRVSDITIGDYWNADSIMSLEQYSDGMSVVLLNTAKGKALFESVKKKLYTKESTLSHAVEGNVNLSRSSEKPGKRDTVYDDLNRNGFAFVVKNYCKFSYLVPFIKSHTPKGLKKLLKKFLG